MMSPREPTPDPSPTAMTGVETDPASPRTKIAHPLDPHPDHKQGSQDPGIKERIAQLCRWVGDVFTKHLTDKILAEHDQYLTSQWPAGEFEKYTGPFEPISITKNQPGNSEGTISQVSPRLFISGLTAPQHRDTLLAYNIGAVLSITRDTVRVPSLVGAAHWNPAENHKQIRIRDLKSENLLHELDEAVAWIDEKLRATSVHLKGPHAKPGAVLIHCRMGRSRSGAVLAAYVAKKTRRNFTEALNGLKTRRDAITSFKSSYFRTQLHCWEDWNYCVWKDGKLPGSEPREDGNQDSPAFTSGLSGETTSRSYRADTVVRAGGSSHKRKNGREKFPGKNGQEKSDHQENKKEGECTDNHKGQNGFAITSRQGRPVSAWIPREVRFGSFGYDTWDRELEAMNRMPKRHRGHNNGEEHKEGENNAEEDNQSKAERRRTE